MATRIVRDALRSAGLSLLAFTLAGGASAETVKVGVVLPFSGGSADVALSELRAMKLYLKLHKAELGKHEIQLIERDSNGRLICRKWAANRRSTLASGINPAMRSASLLISMLRDVAPGSAAMVGRE